MAFCSNCGKEIPDGANVCPSCGTAVGAAPVAVVDPWDHTSEFDAKDISDNNVYALSAYVFSILGVLPSLRDHHCFRSGMQGSGKRALAYQIHRCTALDVTPLANVG